MDSLFEFLNQGWVGLASGFVLFMIGTGLSVYFYRRSRQGAQLAYHYKTIRVLGASGHKLPSEVKILFRDTPIDNLYRSLVLVWNHSDRTIYGRNIAESDPLRIDVGERPKVVDCRIVKAKRSVNKCQVDLKATPDDDVRWMQPVITFDYLDTGDGLVVEMFHTEAERPPMLRGSIHEMPKGFRSFADYFPTQRWFSKFMYLLGFAMSLGLAGAAVWVFTTGGIFLGPLVLALAVFLWRATYLGAFKYRRRYPKSLSMPEFINQ